MNEREWVSGLDLRDHLQQNKPVLWALRSQKTDADRRVQPQTTFSNMIEVVLWLRSPVPFHLIADCTSKHVGFTVLASRPHYGSLSARLCVYLYISISITVSENQGWRASLSCKRWGHFMKIGTKAKPTGWRACFRACYQRWAVSQRSLMSETHWAMKAVGMAWSVFGDGEDKRGVEIKKEWNAKMTRPEVHHYVSTELHPPAWVGKYGRWGVHRDIRRR